MLSASTPTNLFVSDNFAAALCAASLPNTPCDRFAHGHLLCKSAKFALALAVWFSLGFSDCIQSNLRNKVAVKRINIYLLKNLIEYFIKK